MVLLLSSCGHELSTGNKVEPESLAIIGSAPSKLYYDAELEFELGATGGDGVYRYRYIQNPENPDEDDTDFVFNPVELTIENLDGAKPLFKVKGIHRTEKGVDIEDIPRGTYSYQIELTDGKNVKLQSYEFDLDVSGVSVVSAELTPFEGRVDASAANSLLLSRESGNTFICSSIDDNLFEKKTLPNGMTVYPYVFAIALEARILERVEFFYRFSSRYNEQLPEKHKSNLGLARPGVDYVDEERSVVFEAGQDLCVIYIDVLDDSIIEGSEQLSFEFYERKGGYVQNELGLTTIEIKDNEPLPSYQTKKVIRNEGDKIIASLSLARPYLHPLSINVSIDDVNTTASSDDYLLTPENGVVVIPAGDLEASYTVSLLENQDDANLLTDDVISIVTDIDGQLSIDPYEITINEWPLAKDHEIVASSADGEKALALNINSLGVVSVLIEGLSSFDEEQSVVIARKRDGTSLKLSDSATGALLLAKQGLRVKPVAIGSYISNATSLITIIANVDGKFSDDVHRGLGDFVVAVYSRDSSGFYIQQSIKQYGSEGDDIATGATFDGKGGVYVFGTSNGLEFDGVPSFEVNNGKKDGFVYKIDFIENKAIWDSPRFIGTADDDSVLALDIGRNDVVLLAETINTDEDVFLRKISTADNGRDVEGVAEAFISSTTKDHGSAIRFDQNDSIFFSLVDSSSILPSGNPTPSLSRDVNLLSYDAEGRFQATKRVSTSDNDFSVDIEMLTNEDNLVIGGYTQGEFEGNVKKGSSGNDAFISILPSGNSDSSVNTLFQFGTEGDDKLIDIENVSENKFLVLWSEDHTNGGGITRYRVSAFSSEGVMLSKEL